MNLKTFSDEFDFAASAVDKRSTIPILNNVMIKQYSGTITLTGTDLEIGAVTAFPGDKGKIAVTLPTKSTKRALTGLNGADQFLLKAGKDEGTFSHGSFSANVKGMGPESFPELPLLPDSMLVSPMAPLMRAIAATSHAISPEETRFTLNGSLLMMNADGSGFKSVATDGHRLSLATYGNDQECPTRFLMPTRLIRLLPKLGAAEKVALAVNEDFVFFLASLADRSRLLLGRKLKGNFPDYERVVRKQSGLHVKVNRQEFLSVCSRILPFADDRSHAGVLTFKGTIQNSTLTVAAKLTDTGSAQDSVSCSVAMGTDFTIGMDLTYIIEALRQFSCDVVTLHMEKPSDSMQITGAAGEVDLTECIMPMRLS